MVTKEQPLAAIVVLNWNGLNDTLECLHSLVATTYANKRILVVDNGSTDGSPKAIAAEFPQVELLALDTNSGFSSGNNEGIEFLLDSTEANVPDYIMLLNNDTIVSPSFIEPLVAALASEYDVVSPLIYYADEKDKVWFAGARIDWRSGWAYHEPANCADVGQFSGTMPSDYICGCCLMASADTWRAVGKLDDRFFLYWEDVDWSVRAHGQGCKLGVVADSKIRHKVSRSLIPKFAGTFLFVRNGLLFIDKHVQKNKPNVYARFLKQWLVQPSLREFKTGTLSWNILAARLSAVGAHFQHRYGSPYRGES